MWRVHPCSSEALLPPVRYESERRHPSARAAFLVDAPLRTPFLAVCFRTQPYKSLRVSSIDFKNRRNAGVSVQGLGTGRIDCRSISCIGSMLTELSRSKPSSAKTGITSASFSDFLEQPCGDQPPSNQSLKVSR